jgi:phosphohistidine phosphatase
VKRVYFIRHGKAEDFGPSGADEDRRLTPDGKREVAAVAKHLRRLDEKISIVLSSPLRRAVETAEIFAEALGVKAEIVPELDPPVSAQKILNFVKRREEHRIVLVGHEPGFGQTIARWLEAHAQALPMKKAAIARLDVPEEGEGGPIGLAWMAPPDLFLKSKD